MTLGTFYVIKRIGDTDYSSLLNDFYHVTHYINENYLLPYLNWVFLLEETDFFKLVEGLGLEGIKSRKFELVSLMTFLNYRASKDTRNVEPEDMRSIINKTKLTDDVQDNITKLINNFDKTYNKSNDLSKSMVDLFDEKATYKDIYYICYNIISFALDSIDYDYTTDSLFYLASEYMESFVESVGMEGTYTISKLSRYFGTPVNYLPNVIRYSTIHSQIGRINKSLPDTVKLVDLVNYTDGAISKDLDKKMYKDRYDMLTEMTNPQ